MPFPTTDRATRLRHRADHLADLAARIERSEVLRLDQHGGVDTWRGPTASACAAELRHLQHRLHAAADDLRVRAWRLRREADELDRLAAIAGAAS